MGRWRPPVKQGSPYITAAGYAALEAELEAIWKRRRSVVKHLAAAAAEGEDMVVVKQEYPRQESMVGPEYQATIPKALAGANKISAQTKTSRRDERVFSPRLASREGVDLEAYLARVRAGIQFHLAPSRAQPRDPAVLSGDYRNESAPDVFSAPEAQP